MASIVDGLDLPAELIHLHIPANAQTLTWKYAKDGSANSGQDTAWIDDIVITPTGGAGNGEGSWTSPAFRTTIIWTRRN